MTTWIKENLTGLLSFTIIILTGLQGLKDFGLVNDLQYVAMVVSTFVVVVVPLLKVRWAGALKTSLDLAGAGVTIAIPFVALWVAGTPVTRDAIVLMIIAFVKAIATEFGVQIRTDWGATTPKVLAADPTIHS
jgi:hypothetical protein